MAANDVPPGITLDQPIPTTASGAATALTQPVPAGITLDPKPVAAQQGIPGQYLSQDRSLAPREPVTDSQSQGAGFLTNLRAGMAPNDVDQIHRFAAARFPGMPIDKAVQRYGVINGDIVYADPEGNYVRETPSVRGATGVGDAFRRVGDFVAKNTGAAIPQAAGTIVGTAMGPTGLSIPAAAVTAGAVDAGRQVLDQWGAGEPLHVDWLNSAGQAANTAVGQGLSVGTSRLLTSNPMGVKAYDRVAAQDPATLANAAALEAEAKSRGVDLSAGQATGLRSLQATERQLGRYPETADPIYDFTKNQRQVQIPAAVRDEIGQISPVEPGETAVGQFRSAANDVLQDALSQRAAQARQTYTTALEKEPFWSDDLSNLMNRPALKQAWTNAQTIAANEGRELPQIFKTDEAGRIVGTETVPDWRTLDYIKKGLDQAVDATANPVTGKLDSAGRAINIARKDFLGILDTANPDYLAARLQYGKASETVNEMMDGGLGILAKLKQSSPMDRQAIVQRVFDSGNLTPQEVGRMRTQFGLAGKGDEWNAGFASWLSDKLDNAIAQAGDAGNVSAKLYKGVWQDPRQQKIVQVALGGDPQRVAGIENLMKVVQASQRGLPEGSPTVTDTLAANSDSGKMISGTARLAGKALSMETYLNAGDNLVNGIAALRAPGARIKLAETLLSGDVSDKLKQLAMLPPLHQKALMIASQILDKVGVMSSGVTDPKDRAPKDASPIPPPVGRGGPGVAALP